MNKNLNFKNYICISSYRKKSRSGFSLFEVILYIAILSTLIFGVGSLLNLVSVARVKNQTMSEVDQQAIQIIQNITKSINSAKSISTPIISKSQNTLTLVDLNDNPITYYLDQGVLIIDRGLENINLNNNRVLIDNIIFTNLSRVGTPDIIQIKFTITYNNDSNNQVYNYSKNYVASANIYK